MNLIDYAIFDRFVESQPALPPRDGYFANFLGLYTPAHLFPSRTDLSGRVSQAAPIPDDGVYGSSAEYASLLTAIDSTTSRDRFTAVELGAGWGPWISAAGVLCRKLGFRNVRLKGVEADPQKHLEMKEHLRRHGLTSSSGSGATTAFQTDAIHGAAWSTDMVLSFPKALPMHDYGAAVTEQRSDLDYRGFSYELEEVQGYSLETLCADLPETIDYMHWDIQGTELDLAETSKDLLARRVRHLFIGTHSREIEGRLLRLFFELGWDLLILQACKFHYIREARSLEGMTTADGEFFVRNPKL